MIKHILLTPFNFYLIGWIDRDGNCHEKICITKEDLIDLLDDVFGIDRFNNFDL